MAFLPLIAAAPVVTAAALYLGKEAVNLVYSKEAQWTTDLVGLAAQGKLCSQVYARETFLQRIIAAIGGKRGIVILEGPAGVGKSALIEEIARRIAQDQIPVLRGVKILNVDLKLILGTRGIAREFKNALFGNISESIQALVKEVTQKNQRSSGPMCVLFIDEIQQLIDIDPNAFDALKDLLARQGAIIVGATTDALLLKDWLARQEGERGMDRRVELISIPSMDAEEMAKALQQNQASLQDKYKVSFDPHALEDLVTLASQEKGNFPAKAMRRIEQVAIHAINQGADAVTQSTVLSYFQTVTNESQEALQHQLAIVKNRRYFKAQFLHRYFPLASQLSTPVSNLGKSVGVRLERFEAQQRNPWIVETPAEGMLREGLQSIADRTKRKIRICSVTQLLKMMRDDGQERLALLKSFLGTVKTNRTETLCIEANEELLEELFGGGVSRRYLPAAEGAPLSQLVQAGRRAIGQVAGPAVAEQIDGIFDPSPAPRVPQHRKAAGTSSPVIAELVRYINEGNPCVLIASSQQTARVAAAEQSGQAVLRLPELAPQQIVEWLSSKYPDRQTECGPLVRAIGFLKARKTQWSVSIADFCDRVLQSKDPLIAAICCEAPAFLDEREVALALRAPLEMARPSMGKLPPLAQMVPVLLSMIRNDSNGGRIISIEEASQAQQELLQDILVSEQGFIALNLSQLSQYSPEWQVLHVQEEIQRLQERVPPRIIVREVDLKIGALEPQLLKLVREQNAQVICLKGAPMVSPNAVGSALQAGAHWLEQQTGVSVPVTAPVTPRLWEGVPQVSLTLEPMNSSQFSLWIRSRLPTDWSETVKGSFAKLYQHLYESKALTLEQIAHQIGEEPPTGDNLVPYFTAKLEPLTQMTERQVAYLLDPATTPLYYRAYRNLEAACSLFVQGALYPLGWMKGYLLQAIGWASGNFIVSRIALYWTKNKFIVHNPLVLNT